MTVSPPVDDADVPRYWRELGLPGLVDVHVHFLPERVQAKVWQYFADAETHYGAPWPVNYPFPVPERLAVLASLGVRAFPLDQIADAHRLVGEGHVRGKVVVTLT